MGKNNYYYNLVFLTEMILGFSSEYFESSRAGSVLTENGYYLKYDGLINQMAAALRGRDLKTLSTNTTNSCGYQTYIGGKSITRTQFYGRQENPIYPFNDLSNLKGNITDYSWIRENIEDYDILQAYPQFKIKNESPFFRLFYLVNLCIEKIRDLSCDIDVSKNIDETIDKVFGVDTDHIMERIVCPIITDEQSSSELLYDQKHQLSYENYRMSLVTRIPSFRLKVAIVDIDNHLADAYFKLYKATIEQYFEEFDLPIKFMNCINEDTYGIVGKTDYDPDATFLYNFCIMLKSAIKDDSLNLQSEETDPEIIEKIPLIGFFIPEIRAERGKIFTCEKNLLTDPSAPEIPKLYLMSINKTITIPADYWVLFKKAYYWDFLHDYNSGVRRDKLLKVAEKKRLKELSKADIYNVYENIFSDESKFKPNMISNVENELLQLILNDKVDKVIYAVNNFDEVALFKLIDYKLDDYKKRDVISNIKAIIHATDADVEEITNNEDKMKYMNIINTCYDKMESTHVPPHHQRGVTAGTKPDPKYWINNASLINYTNKICTYGSMLDAQGNCGNCILYIPVNDMERKNNHIYVDLDTEQKYEFIIVNFYTINIEYTVFKLKHNDEDIKITVNDIECYICILVTTKVEVIFTDIIGEDITFDYLSGDCKTQTQGNVRKFHEETSYTRKNQTIGFSQAFCNTINEDIFNNFDKNSYNEKKKKEDILDKILSHTLEGSIGEGANIIIYGTPATQDFCSAKNVAEKVSQWPNYNNLEDNRILRGNYFKKYMGDHLQELELLFGGHDPTFFGLLNNDRPSAARIILFYCMLDIPLPPNYTKHLQKLSTKFKTLVNFKGKTGGSSKFNYKSKGGAGKCNDDILYNYWLTENDIPNDDKIKGIYNGIKYDPKSLDILVAFVKNDYEFIDSNINMDHEITTIIGVINNMDEPDPIDPCSCEGHMDGGSNIKSKKVKKKTKKTRKTKRKTKRKSKSRRTKKRKSKKRSKRKYIK